MLTVSDFSIALIGEENKDFRICKFVGSSIVSGFCFVVLNSSFSPIPCITLCIESSPNPLIALCLCLSFVSFFVLMEGHTLEEGFESCIFEIFPQALSFVGIICAG